MNGHGVIKPGGNRSDWDCLDVSIEVSSIGGSFVEDLLPKNLVINLFPPCFMVVVPEIEDDFEERLGRSFASFVTPGAIIALICISLREVRVG
jgi:hypothetical protein